MSLDDGLCNAVDHQFPIFSGRRSCGSDAGGRRGVSVGGRHHDLMGWQIGLLGGKLFSSFDCVRIHTEIVHDHHRNTGLAVLKNDGTGIQGVMNGFCEVLMKLAQHIDGEVPGADIDDCRTRL